MTGNKNGAATHDGGRQRPPGLSKNEKLVWNVLAASDDPLKAYEILDKLKDKGVRAPMTVYRALDGLEEKGHIHKLDGLNAFVLCNHEGPHRVPDFPCMRDLFHGARAGGCGGRSRYCSGGKSGLIRHAYGSA